MIKHLLKAAAGLGLALSFTLGTSALPVIQAAPAAAADEVDCAMLLVGQPCTFTFAEHAGETHITIPEHLQHVTVVLQGASGAGGTHGQGSAGVGGSVIAAVATDTTAHKELTVWLGQDAAGLNGDSEGWSRGGRGGHSVHEGAGGGGSSGLSYTSAGHDEPLIVAGGGGGGGGESGPGMNDAGPGGAGGNPGQNGIKGKSGSGSVWGPGGKGGGSGSSTGGGGGDGPGGGGGGGGGGYEHGGSGGSAGGFSASQRVGSGGGGGGGDSYGSPQLHQLLGFASAPLGHGTITIYPGVPESYSCVNTHDARSIPVPTAVGSYAFFAMGGAGTHGHSEAPEGTGAIVTGLLDVHDITELHYWVGCSGYDHGGAGYGDPGHGGEAPRGGDTGGHGGGATAITTADGHMLVAAGGGGGSGGDINGCDDTSPYPGGDCGGAGGSSGGHPHTRLTAHGQEGGDGIAGGGDGGCASCHKEGGHPSPNGGNGVSPPSDEILTGGGGGGGAGYPAGGAGGHHDEGAPGGGGGAGGSYVAKSRVSHGSITASGHYGSGFLLLIPIEKLVTDLTVQATASGAAASHAVAPFTFAVHCELAGQTTLDRTISLNAGQSHEFTGVQQHSVCTVKETGTGGASTPAGDQTVTLTSAPTTVTMANVFAAGDLALGLRSAIVNAADDPVSGVDITLGDLTLAIECSIAGHPLALPAGGLFTVPGQETWGAGWTGSIDDLPVGADCAIKETVDGGATLVEYSADGGAPVEHFEETEIAATGSSLAVINHFETGSLDVGKTADGDGTPPDGATYSGTVTCTFGGQPVVFTPALPAFDLAVGGTTQYSPIPIGSHCTVTETDQGIAQLVSYLPSATVAVDSDADVDVSVRNTFQSGSLHVQVGRAGPGAHWANGGYDVQVSCTDGTTDEFTTGADGGWRSYTPDAGATCTITEIADGGATTVTSVTSSDPAPAAGPAVIEIPGTGFASVTITNTFEAARLYIDVTNSGPGAKFSDGSIIHVEACDLDDVPFDIADGGVWTIIPGHAGGFAASPLIPVGAQCNVRIADDAGGVPTVTPVNVDPTAVVNGSTLQVTVNDPLLGVAIVEIDFAFAVAPLEITVTNEGDGASFANVPFEVEVACEIDGDTLSHFGTNGKITIHFAPDGTLIPDAASAQLAALPVGGACSAVETVTGGATQWGTNPPGTTIEADGSTLAITNVFPTSTLTVTALIAGNDEAAHASDGFVFDADCRFNGIPIAPSATIPVTFELGPNQQRVLTLPSGAECTVTETHDEHATTVSPSATQTTPVPYGVDSALSFTNTFDVDHVTIEQTVSGAGADTYGMGVVYVPDLHCTWPSDGEQINLPENGKVELDAAGFFTATVQVPVGATCGAQEPYGLASRLVPPEPITVALGGEFVLVLEAVYNVGQLSVEKDARGNGIAGLQFGFKTTCTFETDDGPVDIPLNEFADETYSLGDSEVMLLEALHGATCTTTEVAAHDPLRVAVEAGGFGAASFDRSAFNVIVDGIPSSALVTNFFVGSLPLTGSEISSVALWVGLTVLLGGIAIVVVAVVRRRRLE